MTKKTLLVGWDSVCWEYLNPLLGEGRLPNLHALLDQGCSGVLRSTIPPITPAAWSSIITGKLPQKHGVYDWVAGAQGHLKVARSSDVRGTRFWERLNEQGVRVGLVNIPLTYPIKPIEGFVVCGFGAPPSSRELTYPRDLLEELEEACGGYTPILSQDRVNALREAGAQLPLYQAEKEIQAQHVQAALYGARKYDVDVLAIDLMLFDHTNHHAREFTLVREAMEETDKQLGLLIDGFGPDDVILFSDHGARRFKGLFLIGDWLEEQGYLTRQLKQDQTVGELNFLLLRYLQDGHHLDGIAERPLRAVLREAWSVVPKRLRDRLWADVQDRVPRAFDHYWVHRTEVDQARSEVARVLNTGTLYFNGRGSAGSSRAEGVMAELTAALESITEPETGLPVFERVKTGAELYGDEPMGDPPHLFLDNYGSSFGLDSPRADIGLQERFPHFIWFADNPGMAFAQYGGHSHQGICVVSGSQFARDGQMSEGHVVDVPANLLHAYGVAIPKDWDGDVLADAFSESRPVLNQRGDQPDAGQDQGADDEITGSEQKQIVDRLRQLGYVE